MTNKSFESTITSKPAVKRKSFELHSNATKDEKTAKKIVLNRNLSTDVQSENNETPDTATNGDTEEKKVIKLSELSAKEVNKKYILCLIFRCDVSLAAVDLELMSLEVLRALYR